MDEAIELALRHGFRFVKSALGWLIQAIYEIVFEVLMHGAIDLLERLHGRLHSLFRTRWLSLPVTIVIAAAILAVPFQLLVSLLRAMD